MDKNDADILNIRQLKIEEKYFISNEKRNFYQDKYFTLLQEYSTVLATIKLEQKKLYEMEKEVTRLSEEYLQLAIKNKHLERELSTLKKHKSVPKTKVKKVEE